MITQEDLKILFHYDPKTGVFTRIKNSCRGKIGDVAGSFYKQGYRRIKIDQRAYKEHRLAWLYMYGKFPEQEIDHIDRNKANNKITNLRLAHRAQNNHNHPITKRNTSGYKGVDLFKPTNKWRARASISNNVYNLGYFDTPKEASDAYEEFCKIHHGEFYNNSQKDKNQ